MRAQSLSALGLVVLTAGTLQAAEVGVPASFGPPRVIVTRQAGTHLLREATVTVAAGDNQLSFDFARVGADAATARLAVLSPADGVRIVELRQPVGEATRLVWVLQAAQATACRLRLSYQLKGLETSLAYTVNLRPAEQTLDLEARLVLRNASPEPLSHAEVVLPSGQRVAADLTTGETVLQRLFVCQKLPYESSYLYDNSRFGGAVHATVRLARDGAGEFDAQRLPAGSVKVYAPAPGGLTSFVGEVALPYRPPHEPIELDLGSVQEITVSRTRVRADQLNVKSDVYRRTVLFDLDEQFDLAIASQRPGPVTLKVQEHIAGAWTMLKQTHPSDQLEAGTVQFTLKLSPGEAVALSYTVRRLNVEP
jgi:hypothetical protein